MSSADLFIPLSNHKFKYAPSRYLYTLIRLALRDHRRTLESYLRPYSPNRGGPNRAAAMYFTAQHSQICQNVSALTASSAAFFTVRGDMREDSIRAGRRARGEVGKCPARSAERWRAIVRAAR